MSIFVTGTTGYLGSYVAHLLLTEHTDRLAVLVRASDEDHARQRLWKAWQLHMDFATFEPLLEDRVDVYCGDLTSRRFGLSDTDYDRLAHTMDSVIHVAASLNRRSAKACFNVNLRGTLEVVKLARAAADHHGLRRFSDVSTAAVVGRREGLIVPEPDMVDWSISDFDPYARTKKFTEHMVHELLHDVPTTVFRPSTVLGDSRFAETTQFDMVRAFVFLANLPVLPLDRSWRHDIVPADQVSRWLVAIHQGETPAHDSYNLSAGAAAQTYGQITDAIVAASGRSAPRFAPWLAGSFDRVAGWLSNTPRGWGVSSPAAMMKVFMPYLTFDTVFDNSRIVEATGEAPAPFSDYAYGLMRFAMDGGFEYPYEPWPTEGGA